MIGRDHSQSGRNVKEAVSRGNPALRCGQVTGRRGGVGQGSGRSAVRKVGRVEGKDAGKCYVAGSMGDVGAFGVYECECEWTRGTINNNVIS